MSLTRGVVLDFVTRSGILAQTSHELTALPSAWAISPCERERRLRQETAGVRGLIAMRIHGNAATLSRCRAFM